MNLKQNNLFRALGFTQGLFAIAVLLFPVHSAQGNEVITSSKPYDSYEFKVMLDNSIFSKDQDRAIDDFMGRFRDNLADQGIDAKKIKPKKKWKVKYREVRFLDTQDNRLYNYGLIFRVRMYTDKSCPGGNLTTCKTRKAKITLKQRFNGETENNLFDLSVRNTRGAFFDGQEVEKEEPKFELDYSWKNNENGKPVHNNKPSYSSSIIINPPVKLKEHIAKTFYINEIMEVYPKVPWSDLDIKPKEQIKTLCTIHSTKIEVGKFMIKETKSCEASFTFWDIQKEDNHLASEFSFKCEYPQNEFAAIKESCESIYDKLITDPFLDKNPSTKTALAYSCGASKH